MYWPLMEMDSMSSEESMALLRGVGDRKMKTGRLLVQDLC